MTVAAIYDIHGNLPALEAVLADIRAAEVDRLVVGGDVIPGPMSRECLAVLREMDLPVQFLYGNGEREVLTLRAGAPLSHLPESVQRVMTWVSQQLDPDLAEWLAVWPPTVEADVPGLGRVLFCHATPRNDTDIFTRMTPEDRLIPLFAVLDVGLVVCGHTHMQDDRMVGGVRVVNAGSVGMPFGEAAAHWLLLGPEIELRRTRYDLTRAAARIRETSYPQAEEFAARDVLRPRSEDEALKLFAGVVLE